MERHYKRGTDTLQGGVDIIYGGGGQTLRVLCLRFFAYVRVYFLIIRPHLGPFGPYLDLFGPFGAILGLGSGPKTFLGPTYIA